MADYKELKGKPVRNLASDVDNAEGEGEIWFNTATNDYKTIISANTWSTGNNLNTGRGKGANAGTQTAALWAGGESFSNASEEYNGISWAEGNNLTTGRLYIGGTGTQTAGLAFGGRTPPSTKVTLSEEYNGTSWAEGGDIPTGLDAMSGCGTQTAALGIGGQPPASNVVNTYDGSSWTNTGDNINQARYAGSSCGTTTAALFVGGYTPGVEDVVEEYDGSSWTEVTDMPTASQGGAMSGIQTAALHFGGSPPGVHCDYYDGVSWAEQGSLSTGRIFLGGTPAGTSRVALAYGGGDGTTEAETEEFNYSTLASGAWASGGDLNTARGIMASAGSATAGLCISGQTTGGGTTVNVEKYDGSSWTEVANVQAANEYLTGFGSNTVALKTGGLTPGTDDTETWDDTSWTEVGDMNTPKGNLAGAGTTTAGLVVGGNPFLNETELWNGTGWSETANLTTGRQALSSLGTQTAALCVGGKSDPTTRTDIVESWNGTSWTEVADLNTGREFLSTAGIESSGLAYAGNVPGVQAVTETYDGVTWTEEADLSTARMQAGSTPANAAGDNSAAICFGGGLVVTTEEWTMPQNVEVITD